MYKSNCYSKALFVNGQVMTFMTIRYFFTLHSLFCFCWVVDIPLSIDQRKYSASYIRSYTYREIPCRVLSVVNPGQTAKLFGATEFLRQQRPGMRASAVHSTYKICRATLSACRQFDRNEISIFNRA